MLPSCFTDEQHGENFEKIVHLAIKGGYSVRAYESKEATQFDFLKEVYMDTTTIV